MYIRNICSGSILKCILCEMHLNFNLTWIRNIGIYIFILQLIDLAYHIYS